MTKRTEQLTRMTLADGRVYERIATTKRNWSSALMLLAPYGTDFRGVKFEVVK